MMKLIMATVFHIDMHILSAEIQQGTLTIVCSICILCTVYYILDTGNYILCTICYIKGDLLLVIRVC